MGAEALLDVWEQGVGRGPQERPLTLLAAASSDRDLSEIARLPVGRRDSEMLDLRERLLGARLEATSKCPRCGVMSVFTITVDELRAAGEGASTLTVRRQTFIAEGVEVRVRTPDGTDLVAVSSAPDVPTARSRLLDRCVESARLAGEEIPPSRLPESVVAAIGQRLEEMDPLAVIPLALSCSSCGNEWLPLFDPADFLWRELEAEAERLLNDVHTLALAYHWSEEKILAMSPARRDYYLGLVPTAPGGGEAPGHDRPGLRRG